MYHLVRQNTVVDSRELLGESWGGIDGLGTKSPGALSVAGIYLGVPGRMPPNLDPDSEQAVMVPRFDTRNNEVLEDYERRFLPPGVSLGLKCKSILKATEWTQLPDAPLLAAGVTAWRNYRASIRALLSTTPDPSNPNWPAVPPTRGELD